MTFSKSQIHEKHKLLGTSVNKHFFASVKSEIVHEKFTSCFRYLIQRWANTMFHVVCYHQTSSEIVPLGAARKKAIADK